MLTRNYRCVHRYTCLSVALLVRLFEFGTRYTANREASRRRDKGWKDGAFIFENDSSMKFLNLRRVFVYNYPFKWLFIACVTNKVVILDDGYALHYENSHAWSTIWYNNQATIQSTF